MTAPAGTAEDDLLRLLSEHGVEQVPLLDGDGRVVDVVLLKDFVHSAAPTTRSC